MKLVNVIPIAKGAPQENLSYFTAKDVQPGALVTVPLRKKIVPAIVASVEEIKDIKAGLKKIQFKLKPIKSIQSASFLEPAFIEACEKIAKYFVSPLGAVIKDFIPQAILESQRESFGTQKDSPLKKSPHHEIILIQAPKTERFQYYKSIIREEFAKGHSVFFCLPAVFEINEFLNELQKGIEKYTVTMHGKISAKKIRERWNKILQEKHPLLIIATKSFFSLPRKDIGALIIDCESSPFYRLQKRPYIDVRMAAEIFSENMKTRLIFGDFFIRSETFYRHESNSYPASRLLSEAEQVIIDMKSKNFSIISEEFKKMIKEAMENKEKIILFINRRGHSPTTFCQDCQRTILCDKCDTPLVIHKKEGHKINFICHKCLEETVVFDKCPYCKSHRLETLGIGIQKTAGEVKKLFPNAKIFIMDSDTIKTEKKGKEIAENFLSAPGGILLGTEMIFSYINMPVENVAAVSVDSLFALPDFRINEKIFYLLLKLRSLGKKKFMIQTRLAEQNLFDYAIKGNISGFYKTEIENRKNFGYPPFKLLIKIIKEGKNRLQIKKEIDQLAKKLEKCLPAGEAGSPLTYPAFIHKIKNIYTWHILIKIDPLTWPDNQKELHQILSSLPPSWKINVDPESLL